MNDFHRDSDGNWWFMTVGKGNKERQIAVSNAMLKALKRWRKHLGLSVLPSPDDQSPSLQKLKAPDQLKVRIIQEKSYNTTLIKLSTNLIELDYFAIETVLIAGGYVVQDEAKRFKITSNDDYSLNQMETLFMSACALLKFHVTEHYYSANAT